MKKILLAVSLTLASIGAYAHPDSRIHYHNQDRSVVFARSFEPKVESTYERGANNRRVRVDTTTTCTNVRVNPRNNHLRCLNEETTVQRYYDRGNNRPDVRPVEPPQIEPVIYRDVERDRNGRTTIVTTTYTCEDSRWSPDRSQALCFNWDRNITRETVKRQPHSQSLDLNGDGRVDQWERVIYQSFRDILDDN